MGAGHAVDDLGVGPHVGVRHRQLRDDGARRAVLADGGVVPAPGEPRRVVVLVANRHLHSATGTDVGGGSGAGDGERQNAGVEVRQNTGVEVMQNTGVEVRQNAGVWGEAEYRR